MRIIVWIAVFTVLFLFGIRYVERHSIYFPMKDITATPAVLGMAYEEVYFTTSDGKKLHGWFVPADDAGSTLLFCHGNAGNLSHRIDKISILRGMGVNVFIFDYRGYGNSEGSPSESGLYKDAAAAYDHLTRQMKVPESDIVLYGESIGSAVAIDLARRSRVKALITEEAFTSVKEMVALAYPFIPYFIFSSRFDALANIPHIVCPKLIMHSKDDEIVPFSMGMKLFSAAKEPKRFLELRGSHNTAFLESEDKYRDGIRSFLSSVGE